MVRTLENRYRWRVLRSWRFPGEEVSGQRQRNIFHVGGVYRRRHGGGRLRHHSAKRSVFRIRPRMEAARWSRDPRRGIRIWAALVLVLHSPRAVAVGNHDCVFAPRLDMVTRTYRSAKPIWQRAIAVESFGKLETGV